MMAMIEDVYCFVVPLEDFTEGHVQWYALMMAMIEDVYCFVVQLEDFTEGHVQWCQ